jgi:anti-sigma factor RsiW
MSCELWHAKLEQYVDSELHGDEAVEVETHLRQCQSCAADALGRMRLKGMTHTAGKRFAPAPEFRLKIAQQVAKQTKPRLWGWRLGWRLGAVMAVLLVAISLGAFWTSHLQRERQLGELADLHVATLASANPIDVVSTDRHTVKPWFAGKLPFTFNLPELQSSPFQLVGGRVAYFEQSPGAQLLFQVRKHQISVFIFSERSLATRMNSANLVEHKLDFTIQTWSQNGLRYFVISDASPADVAGLSDLLKHAG